MYYELNKWEKKIARAAIDKGMNAEYKEGLEKTEAVIKDWRNGTLTNKDAYIKLFKTVEAHDKQIARRYDGLGGSKYLVTVAGILYDGYITEEDVKDFSEETKAQLNRWLSFFAPENEAD